MLAGVWGVVYFVERLRSPTPIGYLISDIVEVEVERSHNCPVEHMRFIEYGHVSSLPRF